MLYKVNIFHTYVLLPQLHLNTEYKHEPIKITGSYLMTYTYLDIYLKIHLHKNASRFRILYLNYPYTCSQHFVKRNFQKKKILHPNFNGKIHFI